MTTLVSLGEFSIDAVEQPWERKGLFAEGRKRELRIRPGGNVIRGSRADQRCAEVNRALLATTERHGFGHIGSE